MAGTQTIVLSSGGLRSLIATAAALSETNRGKAVLLHLRDGRPAAPRLREFVKRQAEHFRILHTVELDMPHLSPDESFQGGSDQGWMPLVRPQVLLIALAQAMELRASRLVWPVQFNADFHAIARATEQIELALQLAQLERPDIPSIETPLAELTDRQLIELGAQLDVPWELSWSCTLPGEKPCRACPACKRRRHAFESAGMVDPVDRPTAMTMR